MMITYLLEGELLKGVANSGDSKASCALAACGYGKSNLRVVGLLVD